MIERSHRDPAARSNHTLVANASAPVLAVGWVHEDALPTPGLEVGRKSCDDLHRIPRQRDAPLLGVRDS